MTDDNDDDNSVECTGQSAAAVPKRKLPQSATHNKVTKAAAAQMCEDSDEDSDCDDSDASGDCDTDTDSVREDMQQSQSTSAAGITDAEKEFLASNTVFSSVLSGNSSGAVVNMKWDERKFLSIAHTKYSKSRPVGAQDNVAGVAIAEGVSVNSVNSQSEGDSTVLNAMELNA